MLPSEARIVHTSLEFCLGLLLLPSSVLLSNYITHNHMCHLLFLEAVKLNLKQVRKKRSSLGGNSIEFIS